MGWESFDLIWAGQVLINDLIYLEGQDRPGGSLYLSPLHWIRVILLPLVAYKTQKGRLRS